MYAVIKTGGKQYRVAPNDVIVVEKLTAEAGDIVALEDVLLLGEGEATTVGTPTVAGATVAAEVVEQTRGDKIIVFKKLRRKNHRRRNGHRQELTVLRVTEILTDGKKPSAKKSVKPKVTTAKKAEEEDKKSKAKGKQVEETVVETPAPAKKTAKAPVKKAAKPAKKAVSKKPAAKKTAKPAKKTAKPAAKKE